MRYGSRPNTKTRNVKINHRPGAHRWFGKLHASNGRARGKKRFGIFNGKRTRNSMVRTRYCTERTM